ncbi:MAG TPA: acyl-ACP--UDP-N-acetylglucosamine O-acyltransferase [Candidatus Synoicihabitans sp.]|nr:acyl-ACP--UDP-N-acetylglucosamine O-acyltransferase [Candidatus Synoicihabitans sp.]
MPPPARRRQFPLEFEAPPFGVRSDMIHPSAFIDPAAQLGQNVEVMAGAVITRWARVGDNVVVHPGAVIGGDPQYLKFDRATPSYVDVGAATVIREHVTLNRSIHPDQATVIGARCFLMAGCHAGHDCIVADDVVLANNVLLAGHVSVGVFSFVGGGAAIHQFCRVGDVAMVAGLARITRDVPSFTMVAERDDLIGLNFVGLKRRGWPRESMREVKELYRTICTAVGNPREAAAAAATQARSEEARRFLAFFAEGKRGFCRPRRGDASAEHDEG